ncbi:PadR family transcriptional regulator [Corynebacterium spheniscorum]|uniref:DNA-binding transcriptional regulator, PadR family n=1 Tax=Corynebacterium spheniscorum TaxID=185761 RepID=A0A1I2TCW6_9CORY|nr:PadR family transcriptional regulator [Corynebacterium spheniscorum]KAA8719885.1 PadR family transcriptional regulator [Corynebacterium spheniscorum]SFG62695.1 DNA-binding transcriptional regulator, PadR family [Corynebacterium spheniscorum]
MHYSRNTSAHSHEPMLRKGYLELLILAELQREPAYGAELLERCPLELSAGTLYPLLTRLKKLGLIEHAWEESPVGPPRKIYTLSWAGTQRLRDLKAEWVELVEVMNELLFPSAEAPGAEAPTAATEAQPSTTEFSEDSHAPAPISSN